MEDSFSALVVLFILLYDSSLARLNQKGVCAQRGVAGLSGIPTLGDLNLTCLHSGLVF